MSPATVCLQGLLVACAAMPVRYRHCHICVLSCTWSPACAAGLLSVEPFTEAQSALSKKELTDLLTVADIFSPNLVEAASMLGRHRASSSDR